jgi:hypothetical protein
VIGMLFKLIACQPHLMLGLAQSCTNWWSAELRRFGRSWKRRISLYVVGGCSFMLGSMYTGVSVLLWGALPVTGEPLAWTYWAVPLVPFSVSLVCALSLRWMKKPVLFKH